MRAAHLPWVFLVAPAVLCGLVALARAAPPAAQPPSGPPRPYLAADHVPRAVHGDTSMEEWTLSFQGKDGTAIDLTFAISHLWFLPGAVAVEVTVTPPGGGPTLWGGRGATRDVSASAADPSIQFGALGALRGLPPGRLEVSARSDWHDGLALDLVLEPGWPGFILGDGAFRTGEAPDARIDVGVVTPWARARGHLRIADSERDVVGDAWVLHSFSARLPSRLFARRQVVVGRLGAEAWVGVAFQGLVKDGGGTAAALVVSRADGVAWWSSPAEIKWPRAHAERRCTLPDAWVFGGVDARGSPRRLAGTVGEWRQVFGLTDPMKPLTRAAVRAVVGDPILARARGPAKAEWTVDGASKQRAGSVAVRVECADR